jgi:hypothetical protein
VFQTNDMSSDMQSCIEDCLHCYRVCLQTAMGHCLESGGRYVEADHFRLMENCSSLCRTAAEFMLSKSRMHAYVCMACAEVCGECAESCEQIGDMDECVQACRTCMHSCHQMAYGLELGNMPERAHHMVANTMQERLPL